MTYFAVFGLVVAILINLGTLFLGGVLVFSGMVLKDNFTIVTGTGILIAGCTLGWVICKLSPLQITLQVVAS